MICFSLIIIALVLSQKFNNDYNYLENYYVKFLSTSHQHFAIMESYFLEGIDYYLFISLEEFNKFAEFVRKNY